MPAFLICGGKTGDGLNSGFEGLIYVNGSPYCETGSYHEEVIFPTELAGTKVELAIRLWAGLEGGGVPTPQTHQFKQAEIAILDETADDFYYSSRAAVETVRVLDENDSVRRELLTAIDRAHLAIDWRKPSSEAFYESLKKALAVWNEEVSKISYTSPVTVHTVGHSHIDVAWLWQLKHTREKAARTFSTMCTLMEQYPEFTFIQSQPQLYDYIKTDYPDIYERIQKTVKSGNWEPNGAMWVEADCNISSGEALVRQILNGQRFFKEEFGDLQRALASGCVRLQLGPAPDPEAFRHRQFHDDQDQLEPVQPYASRYLPLDRRGRLRGADSFHEHTCHLRQRRLHL